MRLGTCGLALLFTLPGCLSFHTGPLPGEPKAMFFANVGGARIRYTDTGGTGPAVVLIHGFASSLNVWNTVLPALTPKHRVLALDLKGFGWSDRPEGDYSPMAQARLVLDLMRQRGIDQATIVAHSWGSSVALMAAMLAPRRITRLALYDAWVYEEQLPTFFTWARADGLGEFLFGTFYRQRPEDRVPLAFYNKSMVTQAFIDDVEEQLRRPGTTAAALEAARGQMFYRWQHLYPKIQQPTLLLWGREDAVSPLSIGERLSRDLPHAHLVAFPQCGHFPMLEATKVSNEELARFIAAEAP